MSEAVQRSIFEERRPEESVKGCGHKDCVKGPFTVLDSCSPAPTQSGMQCIDTRTIIPLEVQFGRHGRIIPPTILKRSRHMDAFLRAAPVAHRNGDQLALVNGGQQLVRYPAPRAPVGG